jgi:23S rRNA (uracil1939-C5)-methyltransferase
MSAVIRIAARGEGVTADGRHIALAVPGDFVDAVGVVTPGLHHAVPPCRHYPACGGCQLQHADDTAYSAYLVDRIAGALKAQGLGCTEVRVPHLSQPRTRRRATLQVERRGKAVVLGFNEASSHRIVDLTECHVLQSALFALLGPLRALLTTIMPDRARARVALTQADQGIDVLVEGFEVAGLAATEILTAFGARRRLARLSVDEGYGPSPRWEPEPVSVTFSGVPVAMPVGAFLQATSDGEGALVAAVRDACGGAGASADLFSGLGTFALALPGKVHAVEGARDAIIALAETRRVTTEHRDLFRRPLSRAELARFDAVVIDPPRAGAKEQIAELAASTVARIAHVSCNPATFARDAATLVRGGYRLEWIQPVGQFRWSTHVELMAAFTR